MLDPMTASCWISAQHKPGKVIPSPDAQFTHRQPFEASIYIYITALRDDIWSSLGGAAGGPRARIAHIRITKNLANKLFWAIDPSIQHDSTETDPGSCGLRCPVNLPKTPAHLATANGRTRLDSYGVIRRNAIIRALFPRIRQEREYAGCVRIQLDIPKHRCSDGLRIVQTSQTSS